MLDWLDTGTPNTSAIANSIGGTPPIRIDAGYQEALAVAKRPMPGHLEAVAAILSADELEHLRAMSETDPDTVADACRLILAAPAFPDQDDVAELDGLIVRLCALVPWLSGFLPEMQAARHLMAPADVADNLARFRRWVASVEGNRR